MAVGSGTRSGEVSSKCEGYPYNELAILDLGFNVFRAHQLRSCWNAGRNAGRWNESFGLLLDHQYAHTQISRYLLLMQPLYYVLASVPDATLLVHVYVRPCLIGRNGTLRT